MNKIQPETGIASAACGGGALAWALSLPVTRRDKITLAVIIAHANGDGESTPTIATMTAEASLSERSVQGAIH